MKSSIVASKEGVDKEASVWAVGSSTYEIDHNLWIVINKSKEYVGLITTDPSKSIEAMALAMARAISTAIATEGVNFERWDGDLGDSSAVGDLFWDPEEGLGLRVMLVDESFPCGFDCCGTAKWALVKLPIPT